MRFCPLFVACAAAGLLPVGISAAHADSTVVTERTVSGITKDVADSLGTDFQQPLSVAVTYIKGDRSRVESGDKIVLQGVDGGGTITVLDPATRTYYVTTEAEELGRHLPQRPAGDDETMRSIDCSVNPIDGKRTILGLKTSGVRAKISLDFSVPDSDSKKPLRIHLMIDEEEWISDKVPEVPTTVSGEDAYLYLDSAFGSDITAMLKRSVSHQSAEKMPAGAALVSTDVFHIVVPDDAPAEVKQQVPPAFTVREQVLSISHDRLADDLFTVPADYRKVIARVRPAATQGAKPAVASVTSASAR